jgi:hypothetical protein
MHEQQPTNRYMGNRQLSADWRSGWFVKLLLMIVTAHPKTSLIFSVGDTPHDLLQKSPERPVSATIYPAAQKIRSQAEHLSDACHKDNYVVQPLLSFIS